MWLRRIVGALVFLAFVALFSGLEWRVVAWLAPLAKAQYAPAVLAGNVVVAVAITTVAVLNGRLYCSVLCPLGLLQDVANIPGRLVRRLLKRPPQRVSPAVRRVQFVVRHVVLAAFLAVGLCGLGFSWIEPYGIFGRATVLWSGAALAAVVVALALVGRGRAWCSWVCPVGTFLGLLSRVAPFRLRIDAAKCVGCRKCERRCKAGAVSIEGRGGKIDASLCVLCHDCAAECPTTAISPGRTAKCRAEEEGNSGDGLTRKGFIVGTAAAGVTLAAEAAPEEKTVDGGFAEVTPPGVDERNASLKPAGSRSIENFSRRCVGCHLCVKACPNKVLRPSKRAKDWMQPEMAFDMGYCTVDCTRCAEVCPAGAIAPLDAGVSKEDVHVGHAVWHKDRCIAASEGVNCTACERHCPVKAIRRVKSDGGVLLPVVDAEACIGCGACEHVCPSRPMPGMTVAALERHVVRTVAAGSEAPQCGLQAKGGSPR